MTDETQSDRLWTQADVATFLGVSRRTVRDLCGLRRVEIPASGQRPIVRYRPADVKAWADARATGKAAA